MEDQNASRTERVSATAEAADSLRHFERRGMGFSVEGPDAAERASMRREET